MEINVFASEQKYKEVEDNNKRTGKGRKDWKFLDSMTTCLGQGPKVNATFTFDASSQESISTSQTANSSTENGNCSDSSGDDADNDENVVRKELKSRRQRKRKSNSSAAEMLTYTEKGEKAEEEKFNLVREMKDEKKNNFSANFWRF